MTTITVDLASVLGVRPDGMVSIAATPDRPGVAGGWVSGASGDVPMVAGVAVVEGVEPGPARLMVRADAGHDSDFWSEEWQVIVPDQPTVTFADLIDDQTVWPAPVVREAQQARDAAVAAAVRAEAVEVIDDTQTAPSTTWSSTKIAAQVEARSPLAHTHTGDEILLRADTDDGPFEMDGDEILTGFLGMYEVVGTRAPIDGPIFTGAVLIEDRMRIGTGAQRVELSTAIVAGKTQLRAQFATGAPVIIGQEP